MRVRDLLARSYGCIQDGRLYRIFGRFGSVRRVDALCRRFRDWATGRERAALAAAADTLFPGAEPERFEHALRGDGFCTGLRLPAHACDDVLAHARRTPCTTACGGAAFAIADVRNGRTPGGAPVAVADVAPSVPCPAVDRIARDPALLDIVRAHLGYRPQRVMKRLFWSPASDLSEDMRRANGQTIDFHYDIEARNSVYAYFYINGAGPRSGAHVIVAGTHRDKPLSMVLARSFQSEQAILARYGRHRQIVLEGPPGFGFIEDPACFHKVCVPETSDRLVLQLRYS